MDPRALCRISRALQPPTMLDPRGSRRVECVKKILQAFLPPLATVVLPIGRLDVRFIWKNGCRCESDSAASHRAGRLPPEWRSRKTGQTIDHFRSTINLSAQGRERDELSRVRQVFESSRAVFL